MKIEKIKVLTLVGTRPEIIKLSRVISMLDNSCEHILVHTGQNYDYELNQIFFEDMEIRSPDHFLDIKASSALKSIADVIHKLDDLLDELKPDAFLTLGDTNSAYGVIAAKKKKIPIFHMEAGNRCFDMRVPEEVNRILVDHMSDINMPYTDIARDYLISEGLRKDHIIKTGSPMKEVLNHYSEKINSSKILKKLELTKNNYFIVSSHREENLDNESNFKNFIEILVHLDKKYKLPVLVSAHPRLKKKIKSSNISLPENIIFSKPFGFTDYIRLMIDSRLVLSDSGTITEEASILGLKAINLRDAHERPEGSEKAVCISTGMSISRVINAVDAYSNVDIKPIDIVKDYDVMDVSSVVMKTILSYTDHVNRYTWRKNI
jgi:UDP-N-acetylglucosamine 2-epimerase (non-hydrolysing)